MTTLPRAAAVLPRAAAVAATGFAVTCFAAVVLTGCTAAPAETGPTAKPAPAPVSLDADISRTVLVLPTAAPTPDPTGHPAGDVVVVDDLGVLSVAVPAGWSDVDAAPHVDADGREWASLVVSPDIDAFHAGWETPGVEFGGTLVDGPLEEDVLLSFLDDMVGNLAAECERGTVDEPYDDGLYVGYYSTLLACGGTAGAQFFLAAQDAEGTHFVYLSGQLVTDEDQSAAVEAILSSFLMTTEADRPAPADRTPPSVFRTRDAPAASGRAATPWRP